VIFALDDDGQLNDDPDAIDATETQYNEEATASDMNQAPEHGEYPIEETHQVLKYVQERADATTYSREPKLIPIPEKIVVPSITAIKSRPKKAIKFNKRPTKKRPKNRHSK
jgi:hypothetical protein